MKNLLWAIVFLLPTTTYSQDKFEDIWCDFSMEVSYQDTFFVSIYYPCILDIDDLVEDSKLLHNYTDVDINKAHALFYSKRPKTERACATHILKIYFGRLKK